MNTTMRARHRQPGSAIRLPILGRLTGRMRLTLAAAGLALGLVLSGCTPSTPAPSQTTTQDSGPVASVKPAKPKAKTTLAQREAIQAAEQYVDLSGFSRAGLIGQLTSKYGNSFKRADAVFAVDHIKVSWNAEALESAKSYLDEQSFSRAGLIAQLTSKYGSQYTRAQALYAVNKIGL